MPSGQMPPRGRPVSYPTLPPALVLTHLQAQATCAIIMSTYRVRPLVTWVRLARSVRATLDGAGLCVPLSICQYAQNLVDWFHTHTHTYNLEPFGQGTCQRPPFRVAGARLVLPVAARGCTWPMRSSSPIRSSNCARVHDAPAPFQRCAARLAPSRAAWANSTDWSWVMSELR